MPPKRMADPPTTVKGKRIKEEPETTEHTYWSGEEALKGMSPQNSKTTAQEHYLPPENELIRYEDEEEIAYSHDFRTDTLTLLMKIEKLQAELKYERHCRMMAEKELKECKEMNNLMAQMRDSVCELRAVLDRARQECEDDQIESGDSMCVMEQALSGVPDNCAQDDTFTELPGGLKVLKSQYNRISETTDFKKYTSALLMLVFNRETLATHSLQGESPPIQKKIFKSHPYRRSC